MKRLALALALVILATVPLWAGSTYYVNIASQILFYAIFALGVNVLAGYAGLVSLGHAGLFGIAAYGGAKIMTAGHGHLAVTFGALAGHAVAQAIAAVQQLAQPRGHGAFVLEREQQHARQVLVQLALQLELQLGHRPLAPRPLGHVEEVADPFDHLAELIEARARPGLDDLARQRQRQLEALRTMPDEELLARPVLRHPDEVVHLERIVDAVTARELSLHPRSDGLPVMRSLRRQLQTCPS